MINGLVTVALPIYNVEKQLNRCIESVVNQTYKDMEILLIDDGSVDSCPGICDEWAKKDARIRVIHKQNQGLGMARNTGIENANGEYICFFDSDDFIAPETIEKTYRRAKEKNADIVNFGTNFCDENGNVRNSFISPVGNASYEGKEVLGFFLPELISPDPNGGAKLFYMSPCMLLYSMAVIKQSSWRFVSEREIISEDVYSLLSLFKNVKRVEVIPEAFYNYCDNGGSLSRSYRPDRFEKLGKFYNEAKLLCENLGYDAEIIHRVSKPYLSFVIAAMKQESVASSDSKTNRERITTLVNDKTLQEVLEKNKKDKVSFSRRILFFTIRNRLYFLCFALLSGKARN